MKRRMMLGGTILSIGLMLLLSSCGQSDAKTGKDQQNTGAPAVPVRVVELQPTAFADAIQVAGTIKGIEDVMLSPEEGGVVKEWLVRKGQPVRKGDILATLKDDVMKATYDAAAAQYKLAETNYLMQKNIYAERAISELQFRSAEYNRDAAKAQADLAFARLERTRLRSPIDGILNDRFADAGEFVPPGVPVAHIVSLFNLKVVAEISERYAGTVEVGNTVLVIPDAFPGDTLKARVSYIGSAVNASNRSLPVEMFIGNPSRRLKPEMVARVKILRASKLNSLLVSENVVQLVDMGRNIVFVENGGIAHERAVKLGSHQGNLVEVVEGLKPGDRLIVTSIQSLVNGQAVSVAQ